MEWNKLKTLAEVSPFYLGNTSLNLWSNNLNFPEHSQRREKQISRKENIFQPPHLSKSNIYQSWKCMLHNSYTKMYFPSRSAAEAVGNGLAFSIFHQTPKVDPASQAVGLTQNRNNLLGDHSGAYSRGCMARPQTPVKGWQEGKLITHTHLISWL